MDGKIKAPPPAGRMWLVGLENFGILSTEPAGTFARNINDFNVSTAIPMIGECALSHDQPRR